MTVIATSIEIARSPAEVRAVVLDFEGMHEWHTSFLKFLRPLPIGKAPEDLHKDDDMQIKFLSSEANVKIVENSPNALTWEGGSMLVRGCHSLQFEAIDEGRATRFKHGETFTGVFGFGLGLPGVKGSVAALYEGYNRDLKKRCEDGTKQEIVA